MRPASLLRIHRTYKNLGRFRDILNVFLKHGLGQVIEGFRLHQLAPIRWWYTPLHQRLERADEIGIPERLRLAFEELGATFIKFGQLLSTRADLIPREYIREFDALLDNIPPFSVAQARAIIEAELKAPLSELVAEFDESPLAAASIGQVHRAKLWTGEQVVFKVRRPGILELIETDVDILYKLADLVERYVPDLAFLNAAGNVEEFDRAIHEELDFFREAENITRFRNNFEGSSDVYVPQVYLQLSTEQVLVMEYIEGTRIDDVERLQALGFDLGTLARKGSEVLFKMILVDGFFHADPHPGNVFVMADGRLSFIDFGIVGRVREDLLESFGDTFVALLQRDYNALARQSINLGFVPDEVDLQRYSREMRADLANAVEPLVGRKLRQMPPMAYVERTMALAGKYHLRLPRELFLIAKCLVIFESLFRRLSPDLDFFALGRPFARRLVIQRLYVGNLAKKFKREASDLFEEVLALPREMHLALRKITKNDLRVKLQLTDLDPYLRRFDRASNRLTFAVIISAIILGCSIIITVATQAVALQWLVGGGFVLAVLLGLWLVVAILRSGML